MNQSKSFNKKTSVPGSRIILFLILTFGGLAGVAQAHGGGGAPHLSNAVVGPYRVSAWTQPSPLRAGNMHVSIAVSEPPASNAAAEAGSPVLDAIVNVRLNPVDQTGETLAAPATHQNATNKLFYEADLTVPAEGQWQVTILVEGPAGSGHANFQIEVLPPSPFNWAFWGGGLALVLLAAGWILWKLN